MAVAMTIWEMHPRQFFGFSLLSLLSIIPSVHLQNEGSVLDCVLETNRFTNIEEIFIDRKPKEEGEPDPAGSQDVFLQQEVYAREKRQRPFECISDRTEQFSIVTSPQYHQLVSECTAQKPKPWCDSTYKFRNFDGTCNNMQNWNWGSVFNCLRRFQPGNYEGTSGMRRSVCGGPLPEPRRISLSIHKDADVLAPDVTHMHTFFGQFIDRDVTDVPTSFVGDQTIDCCSNPHGFHHPQCAPILLEKDDPFYSKFNITCFSFVRAVPCDTCYVGKRNQMNQVTSYIDLSMIYGQNENMAKSLRSIGFHLMTQLRDSEHLMPPDYTKGMCGSQPGEFCFRSGDRRVNQQSPLMCLQTLFVREHNRIADELRKRNPNCPDDYIYQLARYINIAQMQAIVYKEFLPILLGPDLMNRYGLWIQQHGCSSYDPNVDATTWVEFNTAAYQLHSLINSNVHDYKASDGYEKMRLRDSFKNAEVLYRYEMSFMLEGISMSPTQQYDRYISEDLTNYMYKERKGKYGFDIASFTIQRGRDNGLPSYTEMINYWSGGTINMQSFDDLSRFMNEENINLLKEIYCNVRDIDLWVGLNNERVQGNMMVGPTAGEIIARQFSDWKLGDRFYFEHCENPSFNEEQVQAVRTVTLSSLLCLNTDIKSMQLNAMLLPSEKNPVVLCDYIPKVDLEVFDVGVGR